MWITFIATFIVLLVVVIAMAIGAMRGKPLKGSCGGINCTLCDNRSKCPHRRRA